MTRRRFLASLWLLLVLLSAPLSQLHAQENVLYALTERGQLWRINDLYGNPSPELVRTVLPALWAQYDYVAFDGLVYKDGYFYANYITYIFNTPPTPDTAVYGNIVRFGFTPGDETIIGTNGIYITDLAKAPNGQVYAMIPREGIYTDIGELSLTNGQIVNQKTVSPWNTFYNGYSYWPFLECEGLAYSPSRGGFWILCALANDAVNLAIVTERCRKS